MSPLYTKKELGNYILSSSFQTRLSNKKT